MDVAHLGVYQEQNHAKRHKTPAKQMACTSSVSGEVSGYHARRLQPYTFYTLHSKRQ
jgi:hypothetical protein